MDLKLHLYENNLDIETFARMFNNKSQSYKFYWFEAILNLMKMKDDDLSFDEIMDEMIYEAWHTVTQYHLKLGPTINGNAENYLEHAVNILNNKMPELQMHPTQEGIKAAIKMCNADLYNDKKLLAVYVPYKLLAPFFEKPERIEGLQYLRKEQRSRLIEYMNKLPENDDLFYLIQNGKGLSKTIHINAAWREMVLQNYSIIQSWVQYNKVQFLQDRNPGVPGIIYKIYPESDEVRKLNQVRDLWRKTEEVTGAPIIDIYTSNIIPADELSIDHFVPRSFISNDELWNLIPMSKSLNSQKNNQLPSWETFFEPFVTYQYYLYDLVFPTESSVKYPAIRESFEKCRRNNINSIWATEQLYIEGNSKEQFTEILNHNLKPIYESAQLQGYKQWFM